MASTILVTGAAGFIGSHVAAKLVSRGDGVVGLDDFNDFYDPSIKRRNVAELGSTSSGRFSCVEGDFRDAATLDRVFAQTAFDTVVHLGAWAGVRPSIARPALYMDVNVRGTVELMEAMRRAKVRKLVFASSSSVYGGRTNVPFRETDPVDHPISPYAASKKAGEVLCHAWHHLHGFDVAALRFFTVYGPRQRPEMAIHKFATQMVRGEEIPVYGDGQSERDYTYIDDIVQGVVAATDRVKGYEVYNLGEERTTRLDELVEKLARALDVTPRIRRERDQPGDVPRTCADVSKAKSMLGYRPSTSIDVGLERFVEWFRREGVR